MTLKKNILALRQKKSLNFNLLDFKTLLNHPEIPKSFSENEIYIMSKFIEKIDADFNNVDQRRKYEYREFISSFIKPLYNHINDSIINSNELSFEIISKEIRYIDDLYDKFKDVSNYELTNNTSNTDSYYQKKIDELLSRISILQDEQKITAGKSKDEIKQSKLEAEEANRKIIELRNELELKKRLDDAKENWKQNIVQTFEDLKIYLQPIKDEHTRLNWLFWVYLVMSLLVIIAIIRIEWIAVGHIELMNDLPDFKTYILIYLPLPVAGALLWGFIYQMNRAQRQLVVIAKSIHKVEYVQGLLLSINKLAPNVDDGMIRINAALDKLINNHLNEKEVNTEEDIIKEEKKDVVPVESLIKILKEVKGVWGKE